MFDGNLLVPTSGEDARNLFLAHVSSVEIETFSYCNRICGYCPNSVHDRRSFKAFMSRRHMDMLLNDLSSIDYRNQIVLSHYNEPMSDPRIIEHVAMFREAAPRSSIAMFSNGDYLNREMLDALVNAGLDSLMISIHLAAEEPWDAKKVINRLMEMSRRLNIPADIHHLDLNNAVHATFKTTALRNFVMFENDFTNLGQDRGGLLTNLTGRKQRLAPCSYPFHTFNVSYGGNISPCCQIRGDIASFRDDIIGNLSDFETIFDAYGSDKAAGWRRHLYTTSRKEGPCRTCDAGMVELDDADLARRETVLASVPVLALAPVLASVQVPPSPAAARLPEPVADTSAPAIITRMAEGFVAGRDAEVVLSALYRRSDLPDDAALARLAAAAPVGQIALVALVDDLKPPDLESIVILLAALRATRGDDAWIHYNLCKYLNRLTASGVAAARLPAIIHSFLAIEGLRNNAPVAKELPLNVLKHELATIAPALACA